MYGFLGPPLTHRLHFEDIVLVIWFIYHLRPHTWYKTLKRITVTLYVRSPSKKWIMLFISNILEIRKSSVHSFMFLILRDLLFTVKYAQMIKKNYLNCDWSSYQLLGWMYFIIFLLCTSQPYLSPHKQWFITVFVCHKLIYALPWRLWAVCTRRFIKYPSPLLIQVCLVIKAAGAPSFVLLSVYFLSRPAWVWHTQTAMHTNGSLTRCLTMKTSWHWRRAYCGPEPAVNFVSV